MRETSLTLLRAVLLLGLVLLAACSTSGDGNETPEPKYFPTVNDPDMEINVTPAPTGQTGYFRVSVNRIGQQSPGVGWYANGEIYISVPIELGQPDNPDESFMFSGVGFGQAGFDASANICTDLGSWPVEYSAYGFFDVKDCSVQMTIEEKWAYTQAYAECLGYAGSYSGGPYMLRFSNLNFTAGSTRVDTELAQDMISWINTFKLYPREGLEDTGCQWSAPEGD